MLNFHFLETEFLEKYLGRWKQDVEGTFSLTQDKKSRMQLSKQNLHGWNLTILSQGYSAENGGQSLMGNNFNKSFNFL